VNRVQRVLLLGATGRLGAAIANRIERPPKAHINADGASPKTGSSPAGSALELLAPPRVALALDVRKPLEAAERWIETWKPGVIVNCIAMSDVDRCEHEPLEAMQINAELPGALAQAARRANAHLVHFSTDFVFDGELRRPYREDDQAVPLSVYGESKLRGEKAIASENPSHWVFRISWLYGSRERNLAATLLDPDNAGRAIALAADRVGVPNPVQLLAREVVMAIGSVQAPQRPASGIYHLSCRGQTTWHEFGRAFVAQAIDAGFLVPDRAPRIEATNEKTAGRLARRPPWSVLDPSKYEAAFDRPLPDWRSAITLALQRGE
jgi:dTDP-4-dehydrorhamnose reductase